MPCFLVVILVDFASSKTLLAFHPGCVRVRVRVLFYSYAFSFDGVDSGWNVRVV
jgi:hypothetical protein